jgi:hypothetical protein
MFRARLLILALLFVYACSEAPKGVLITLAGAKDIETSTLRGMNTLQYSVNVRYPAKAQIQSVKDQLQKLGWKPIPYIYLFPKNSSSQVLGWTLFNDPPRDPTWMIYEWTGDWLDKNGNLVTYTFRYRDPIGKYQQSTFIVGPSEKEMTVTAIYTPVGIAKHKQEMLNGENSNAQTQSSK